MNKSKIQNRIQQLRADYGRYLQEMAGNAVLIEKASRAGRRQEKLFDLLVGIEGEQTSLNAKLAEIEAKEKKEAEKKVDGKVSEK